MSQVLIPLGYGKVNVVEVDTFTRMLNDQFYDTEEIRMDKPLSCAAGCEYMGLAPNNSSPDAPVWSCIRRTWINNKCVRVQYKEHIAWNQKDTIDW